MARRPPARKQLDKVGIDAVCNMIIRGLPLAMIAQEHELSVEQLHRWIASDPERAARAREARTLSARTWDEMAEARLDAAGDAFELSRAQELASHYRWRATKIAPRDYNDKHDATAGDTLISQMSDEQINARIKALTVADRET